MKRTSIIIGMVCLFYYSTLTGQTETGICGTVGQLQEDFIPDLERNIRRAESNPVQLRSTQYLPIKFHIIGETNGSNALKEARVLDQLAALNKDFADMNVQFYLKDCGFNYINNSAVYKNHEATIGTIMRVNRDNSAINVFIPESANTSATDEGVRTEGYYQKIAFTSTGVVNTDWLVIRKGEISGASVTLSHELGHFFTLAHPHRGWDSDPYDPVRHGNPARATSPGNIPTELQDKSNCTTAGDLLCDTPPDYNFGFGWNNCNYDGGAKDPKGVLVDPEEKLYMGYFLHCDADDYIFSPMQKAAMLASISSQDRSYIRSGWTPGDGPITTLPTLEFPVNDEELGYYTNVPLSWSAVPGAAKYLLEISRLPNYAEGSTTFSLVVNGNSKVIENLEANRKYYWRVRPFNCYDTGTSFTESASFRTGTLTRAREPEFVEGWTVGPNPVRANAALRVTISSTEVFSGRFNWYSLDGRLIKTETEQRFPGGSNTISLSTSELAAGVYVLALETAAGRLSKRVAVLP